MSTFQVGQKVAFHSEWPFHIHAGTVIAVDPAHTEQVGTYDYPAQTKPCEAVRVRWDGDQYFPERAGTETWVPTWNQRLKAVKG